MPNLTLRSTSFRLFLLAGLAGLSLTLAFGHEGHHVECNETAINAVKADIQAMSEGGWTSEGPEPIGLKEID